MEEYRFQTTEHSGVIRLAGTAVEADVKKGLSQWNYAIPYEELRSQPIHYRTTEQSVWYCLGVGLLGIFGAVSELFAPSKHHMPWWMEILMLIGGVGLVTYAYLHRRHHWVTFPSLRNFNLSFAREGRDAAKFEQFVDALARRIHSSSFEK